MPQDGIQSKERLTLVTLNNADDQAATTNACGFDAGMSMRTTARLPSPTTRSVTLEQSP